MELQNKGMELQNKGMELQTREINLARAAGYVDGEGSISWMLLKRQPKSRDSGSLDLRVASGDVLNLQLLQHLFGGELRPAKQRENNKVKCYIWYLNATNAYNALVELLPFLLVKATQAEAAIGYYREYKRLQALKQADAVEKLHHVAYANLRLLKLHNHGEHYENDETPERRNFTQTQPPRATVQAPVESSESFLPW